MQAQELRCPGCFAPIVPSPAAMSRCRYCGATIAIQGAIQGASPGAAPRPAPLVPEGLPNDAPIFLEDVGPNKIEVIKVVREHTKMGLKDAKDLVERAPCVVANWPGHPLRLVYFRDDLVRAGARIR